MKHIIIIAISFLMGTTHAFAQADLAGDTINITPLSAEDLANQTTGPDATFWTDVGTDVADQANPMTASGQASTEVPGGQTGYGSRSTAGIIARPLGGVAGGVVSR